MVIKLLKRPDLEWLEKEAKACKSDRWTVFFTAETHKPECQLRAIVTEDGSWNKLVGEVLQSKLAVIKLNDPFAVKDSTDATEVFSVGLPGVTSVASVDVDELYYSVPHDELLLVVQDFL
ncbi:hypothetical protein HPB49_025355 [Dermacentor silvarum]|uniref:Uncharacterized protein n=1 Tax=Dermacentor silvarum TaxID=543639 RepID=A0ACB8DLR1_DERSI|nr:hypothetical protein HPB49_025355 [Dermacentor silvarum]